MTRALVALAVAVLAALGVAAWHRRPPRETARARALRIGDGDGR